MPPVLRSFEAAAQTLSRRAVVASAVTVVIALSVTSAIWGANITDDPLGVFRSQLAFTPGRFAAAVDGWDIGGFIRMTLAVDYIFPVAYGAAIAGVWSRAARSRGQQGPWWVLIPLTAVAMDWLENSFHLIAAGSILDGSMPSTGFVLVGSIGATIKWGALIGGIAGAASASWRRGDPVWRATAVSLCVLGTALGAAAMTAGLT